MLHMRYDLNRKFNSKNNGFYIKLDISRVMTLGAQIFLS